MGEKSSNTATPDRLRRARAAVSVIARHAALTGDTAVFWGYCLAVDILPARGGWIRLPGAERPVAHGRQTLAAMIAEADELGTPGIVRILDQMAEHYERSSMPADEPEQLTQPAVTRVSIADAESWIKQAVARAMAEQPTAVTDPATDDSVPDLVDRIVRRAQYVALRTTLEVLDGWIKGAEANHDANAHRGETDPCWEQFAPEDIRSMVNDAARELKVPEPWRRS